MYFREWRAQRLIKRYENQYLKSKYARINWSAHVVPTVDRAHLEFKNSSFLQGLKKPYLLRISSNNGAFLEPEEEIWLDVINISFGGRPLPFYPAVKVPSRTKILPEEGASLSIAQLPSGSVCILLFPPKSEIISPGQSFYTVAVFEDPTDLTAREIHKLLYLTFMANLLCSAPVSPTHSSTKAVNALKKLHQKNSEKKDIPFKEIASSVLSVAKIASASAPKIALAVTAIA